ncbi:hypothetical protein LXL04_029061 [Taraxacum kok-saghyz]
MGGSFMQIEVFSDTGNLSRIRSVVCRIESIAILTRPQFRTDLAARPQFRADLTAQPQPGAPPLGPRRWLPPRTPLSGVAAPEPPQYATNPNELHKRALCTIRFSKSQIISIHLHQINTMAINLTAGAISLLTSGEWQKMDLKPVLQLMDLRMVQTQNTTGGGANNKGDKYRVLLSDGSFHQQGMLATQLNDLVTSQKMQKGSIVQLNQFVCNTIRGRLIIIIVDLNVILDKCDIIGDAKPFSQNLPGGEPPSMARPAPPIQSPFNQPPTTFSEDPPTGSVIRPHSNVTPPSHTPDYKPNLPAGNNYMPPVQPPPPNRPPPMYTNRGPVAKNDAPPRILPISALNPYQGRWTIKARVTSKGELRRYNNAKGDGKVFSFDLLDSEGGEIRATCFNTVADNFYNQIEVGKVYYLSKGTLKPAQKAFNHLNNEFEITLDHTSTAQQCPDDDVSIPRQQFHFRSIKEIEEMETNSVLDVIAVVTNVNPAMTITRKNGGEAQKRTLYLKDMSGRTVELTLWGDFCNKEGQTLQETVDSGTFPILAVKSARVYEFNGKTLSTISSSQVSINPDFPEAQKLRTWFDSVGKNIPSVSMSREVTTHTDNWKTISQIKDEKLGTNEKPDYITIKATIMLMRPETFCYTACPINLGERKCSKKVVDNGDGKWRCDKCDKVVDECDYRYIMQLQIYDHTGMTWITAFQETGEEIIGVSAKDLYHMKYVENDEEGFMEVVRGLLHNEYSFKLKVKEESWGEEQRVKSSVVKAEKVKFGSFTKMRLVELEKGKETPDRTAPSGVGQSVGVPSGIGNGNWTRDSPVGY